MPSACAPRSWDWRPITDESRGVTCGIVSSPTVRSIATAAMSAERRARAIGLSFRSTTWTAPEAWSRAETPSIDSMFVPFGGSSSTETTHSPASSRVWRSDSVAEGIAVATTSRSMM